MTSINSNTMVSLVDTTLASGVITLPYTTDIPYRCIMIKDFTGYTNKYSTVTITMASGSLDTFETGLTSIVLSNSFFSISLYANAYSHKWVTLNNYGLTNFSQGQSNTLFGTYSWADYSFNQILSAPISNVFVNPNNYSLFKTSIVLSGTVDIPDTAYSFYFALCNISKSTTVYGNHYNTLTYNYAYLNPVNSNNFSFNYIDYFDLSSFTNGDIYIPLLYIAGYSSGGFNAFTAGIFSFSFEPVVNYVL